MFYLLLDMFHPLQDAFKFYLVQNRLLHNHNHQGSPTYHGKSTETL